MKTKSFKTIALASMMVLGFSLFGTMSAEAGAVTKSVQPAKQPVYTAPGFKSPNPPFVIVKPPVKVMPIQPPVKVVPVLPIKPPVKVLPILKPTKPVIGIPKPAPVQPIKYKM